MPPNLPGLWCRQLLVCGANAEQTALFAQLKIIDKIPFSPSISVQAGLLGAGWILEKGKVMSEAMLFKLEGELAKNKLVTLAAAEAALESLPGGIRTED